MTSPPPNVGMGMQRPPTPLQPQQQHPYYGSMGPVSMAPGQMPMGGPMGPGSHHMGGPPRSMGPTPPPPHMMSGPMGPASMSTPNGPQQPGSMPGAPGASNHVTNAGAPPSGMPPASMTGIKMTASGEMPASMVESSADAAGQPQQQQLTTQPQQPMTGAPGGFPDGLSTDPQQQQQHPMYGPMPAGETLPPFPDPNQEKMGEDGKKKKKKYNKKKKPPEAGAEGGGVGGGGGAESGGADTAAEGATVSLVTKE